MDNLPSIKQLQYFDALVTHGTFSKAAEACYVTQSTLSAGIAALESTIGQPLIDRSRRRLCLTALGEEILVKARSILREGQDILGAAYKFEKPLSGPLRLGIIPTIAPYLLPAIVPEIAQKFPDLELRLHEDLSARLLEKLHQGDVDAILMAFPYDEDRITKTILKSEDFVIAAPKGQWTSRNPARLSDLKDQTLLLLEDGHCLRDHALEACNISSKQQHSTFKATSLPTLIQMVKQGFGLTLLPAMAVQDGITSDLDIIPFHSPAPSRDIGLAWRTKDVRAKEYMLLIDCLTAAM